MSVQASKNWKAVESTNFAGIDRKLTVTGEVEVGAANQEPVLTRAVPQGINPKILILELSTTEDDDVGADVLTWKQAKYEEPIEEDQYSQVEIRDQAIVDVEKLIS